MKRVLIVVAVLLVTGEARSAPAATRLDGELSFWFGDDDALHAPDETLPASLAPGFGERARYTLALDELAPRAERRRRALILELAATPAASAAALAAEAAVRVSLEPDAESMRGALTLRDAGSYVSLAQGSEHRFELRLLPLAGDTLRLGFSEPLTWGGESGPLGDSPYAAARGPIPAAKLAYEDARWSAFLALKTATMNLPAPGEPPRERVQYGVLGGASLRLASHFELALHAGYVEHGALTQPDVRGQPLRTAGASARFSVTHGQSAPAVPGLFPAPRAEARASLHCGLSLEGVLLLQRLKDADHAGAVRWSPAWGTALLAALGFDGFEMVSGVVIRDLMFVVRQGPGWALPETRPAKVQASVERRVLFAARYAAGAFEFGADLALEQPAALFFGAARPAAGGTVALVSGPGRITILPRGAAPSPVLELRPSLGVRASELVGGAIWLQYVRDPNAIGSAPASGPELSVRRSQADFLGYGVGVRAAF